jgi:hypothetical protein
MTSHTCVKIVESYPMQTRWCGQMTCTTNSEKN